MTIKMHRRSFLGSTALATATLVLAPRSRAAGAGELPLFISLEASGAWDPTFFLDPVANNAQVTPFAAANLLTAGNLRYAPRRLPGEGTDIPARYEFEGEDFVDRWGSAITVFNGVDNQTVSHDVGPRVSFSGSNREGIPVLAALAATTAAQRLGALPPLAFVTTGGYAEAAGLVPTTRAGSPATLLRLALPNSSRPGDPLAAQQYQTDAAAAAVRSFRVERQERLRAATNAPRLRLFLDRVLPARSVGTDAAFDALAPAMAEAEAIAGPRGSLVPAASAVMGAMREGACVSAHIDTGGFDTHSDHDSPVDGQRFALARLLEGVDFIARQVEASAELSARGVVLLVGSDFGRTFYNGSGPTRGKDHWPITSMMLLSFGAAHDVLGGNRVVGGTSVGAGRGMSAKNVTAQGEGVVTVAEGGLRLTPALIHQALQAKLGIDSSLSNRFRLPELPAAPLPFFG